MYLAVQVSEITFILRQIAMPSHISTLSSLQNYVLKCAFKSA